MGQGLQGALVGAQQMPASGAWVQPHLLHLSLLSPGLIPVGYLSSILHPFFHLAAFPSLSFCSFLLSSLYL